MAVRGMSARANVQLSVATWARSSGSTPKAARGMPELAELQLTVAIWPCYSGHVKMAAHGTWNGAALCEAVQAATQWCPYSCLGEWVQAHHTAAIRLSMSSVKSNSLSHRSRYSIAWLSLMQDVLVSSMVSHVNSEYVLAAESAE